MQVGESMSNERPAALFLVPELLGILHGCSREEGLFYKREKKESF